MNTAVIKLYFLFNLITKINLAYSYVYMYLNVFFKIKVYTAAAFCGTVFAETVLMNLMRKYAMKSALHNSIGNNLFILFCSSHNLQSTDEAELITRLQLPLI